MLSFVERHPEFANTTLGRDSSARVIASHHAGPMPTGAVIEKMMSAGLLDAIFATATVAPASTFPRATVVVTCADRRSATAGIVNRVRAYSK